MPATTLRHPPSALRRSLLPTTQRPSPPSPSSPLSNRRRSRCHRSSSTTPTALPGRTPRPSVPKVTPNGVAGDGSGVGRSRAARRPPPSRDDVVMTAALGFRISELVLCLISFLVMAADKTQGWGGDSFDRYKEYRYCLAVVVIGFGYVAFQAYSLSYQLVTGKYVISHHLRRHFDFFMDQVLAYLLISASSSAATRVDD